MNRSFAGLCVHALSQEALILHSLTHYSTRDADSLRSDNDLHGLERGISSAILANSTQQLAAADMHCCGSI